MEYAVFIIMLIFSVCIFLYGVYIYFSKKPFLPPRVEVSMKKTEEYRKYLAKMIMIVSPSPILGGLVTLLGDSTLVVILTFIVIIGSFVGFLILGQKIFKEK